MNNELEEYKIDSDKFKGEYFKVTLSYPELIYLQTILECNNLGVLYSDKDIVKHLKDLVYSQSLEQYNLKIVR